MPVHLTMEVCGAALGTIDSALDAFWSVHTHIPDRIRMQVGIATAEIAANIVEHSGARRMSLTLELALTQVQVSFADDGSPLLVDLAGVSMPGPSAECGRGLALASASLDRLSYHRDDEGNHWSLLSREFPNPTAPSGGERECNPIMLPSRSVPNAIAP